MRWTKFGLAGVAGGIVFSTALAAGGGPNFEFLTGFTGNSTQPGTQGSLAAAGHGLQYDWL